MENEGLDINGLVTMDVACGNGFEYDSDEELLEGLFAHGAFDEYMKFIEDMVKLSADMGFSVESVYREGPLTDDYYAGPSERTRIVASHKSGVGRIFYDFQIRIYDQTNGKWIIGDSIEGIDEEYEELMAVEGDQPFTWKLRNIRTSSIGGEEE